MTEAEETIFELIQGGDLPGLRRLLEERPEAAAARNEQGVCALLVALYHRRGDLAEAIAERLPELDLHEAVAIGRRQRVLELVGSPATDVDAFSPDGFTPLHYAAFFDRPEIAELLMQRGAAPSPTSENPMRVQPLHSAAAAGSSEVVVLLLDRGVDPDARQELGFTPLMSAAIGGHRAMARALLARGADPGLESDDGKSARDYALEGGHGELAELLGVAAE